MRSLTETGKNVIALLVVLIATVLLWWSGIVPAAIALATEPEYGAQPRPPRVETWRQPENIYEVTVRGRPMTCRVYDVPDEPGVRCSLCLHRSQSFGSQGCWNTRIGEARVGP